MNWLKLGLPKENDRERESTRKEAVHYDEKDRDN
jgi:hypothetical protein